MQSQITVDKHGRMGKGLVRRRHKISDHIVHKEIMMNTTERSYNNGQTDGLYTDDNVNGQA